MPSQLSQLHSPITGQVARLRQNRDSAYKKRLLIPSKNFHRRPHLRLTKLVTLFSLRYFQNYLRIPPCQIYRILILKSFFKRILLFCSAPF